MGRREIAPLVLSRRAVLGGALASLALPVGASEDRWSALSVPGAVAIMRHARAPGTGDPANFRLGDCATQRNLDAAGRAQARAIGESLRAAGIGFDAVLTSEWCRCRETAELLDLGAVAPEPALNSFFRDRARAGAQTEALRARIVATPGRLMLVTHQVNITAVTGQGVSSGEVFVLHRSAGGGLTLADRVLIPA